MDNSSTGPLPNERSSHEDCFLDFEGCDINEAYECDDGDVYHGQNNLELFRRAVKDRNKGMQRWLEQHHSSTVLDWIRDHPRGDLVCRLHAEEYYVNQTFNRFWRISSQHHEFEFKSMADVLFYLRLSLNAAILDVLRIYSQQSKARLRKTLVPQETFLNDDNGSREVWRGIEEKFSDARKRRLAFLLFHCALRPVEIVRSFPQDFSDVQEVSGMRHDIMEILCQ